MSIFYFQCNDLGVDDREETFSKHVNRAKSNEAVRSILKVHFDDEQQNLNATTINQTYSRIHAERRYG